MERRYIGNQLIPRGDVVGSRFTALHPFSALSACSAVAERIRSHRLDTGFMDENRDTVREDWGQVGKGRAEGSRMYINLNFEG